MWPGDDICIRAPHADTLAYTTTNHAATCMTDSCFHVCTVRCVLLRASRNGVPGRRAEQKPARGGGRTSPLSVERMFGHPRKPEGMGHWDGEARLLGTDLFIRRKVIVGPEKTISKAYTTFHRSSTSAYSSFDGVYNGRQQHQSSANIPARLALAHTYCQRRTMVNLLSTISGFLSESIDPAVGNKSFYDLKAHLPGTKGDFDFVRRGVVEEVKLMVERAQGQGHADRQHCVEMVRDLPQA